MLDTINCDSRSVVSSVSTVTDVSVLEPIMMSIIVVKSIHVGTVI